MALENPLKKDLDNIAQSIDALHRLYNIYFQGGEDEPPREQRRQLDSQIARVKSQVATATNAADRFKATSVVSKYQTMAARWDKTLRGIETGTVIRPQKRK